MPYNSNKRLEREARESLVASDLSAKMKQWRDPNQDPGEGGNTLLLFRLLLFVALLASALWIFWPPKKPDRIQQNQELPTNSPPLAVQEPVPIEQPREQPVVGKSIETPNRYLALAESSYQKPDFASQVRGDAPTGENLLNDARDAIAKGNYSDALNALQNVSAEYKTDVVYLRGHALFGLKKYQQSAVLFGQITGSVRYGEAAQWYEALSLLPDFEQNKSLVLKKLKKMVDDEGHTFYREATELYRKL
ncbi:MAG: hypothetical protein ACKVT2_01185 [Saprospiraceae bacterium]